MSANDISISDVVKNSDNLSDEDLLNQVKDIVLSDSKSISLIDLSKEAISEILSDEDVALRLELERIDTVERTLWEAWEESKTPIKKRIVKENVKKVDGESKLVVSSVQTIIEPRYGDTRIFNLIIKVQGERRKLLGAYRPQRTEQIVQHEFEVKNYRIGHPEAWEVLPAPTDNNGDDAIIVIDE